MAEYFDVLTSIINKKEISEEDIGKHFAGFPAIKWLSINPMACYAANQINSCRGNKYIPNSAEYRFLKQVIKLPKNTRLSFDKNDKEMKIIIDNLKVYFKAGVTTTIEYMNLLGGERLIPILEKIAQINNTYTTDKNILDLRMALAKKNKDLLKIKGKQ